MAEEAEAVKECTEAYMTVAIFDDAGRVVYGEVYTVAPGAGSTMEQLDRIGAANGAASMLIALHGGGVGYMPRESVYEWSKAFGCFVPVW